MADRQLITSFVVRCTLIAINEHSKDKRWRIKVTYVQGEDEIIVTDLDEAVSYMKQVIGE